MQIGDVNEVVDGHEYSGLWDDDVKWSGYAARIDLGRNTVEMVPHVSRNEEDRVRDRWTVSTEA